MKAAITCKLSAFFAILCISQTTHAALAVAAATDATPSILVQAIRTKYCTATPVGTAVLTITKVDSMDPVAGRTPFNYIITVTNTSSVAANNVVVTDTLPSNTATSTVTFNAGSSSTTQGTISASGNIITITIGTMAPGETVIITLNVTITNSFITPRVVTNTAVATSSNAASVSASDTTTILINS